jgi:hypothetical protein
MATLRVDTISGIGSDGPVLDGDLNFNSQNYLTLPKGTTTERSRGRAVFAGLGPNSSNTISYLQIQSTGNAFDFGDLPRVGNRMRGSSSSTRGLFAGQLDPANDATVEYVTISTTSNAISFGELTQGVNNTGMGSNETRAINWEGTNPSTNTISYFTIATLGNAQDFGDMIPGVRHIDTMNSSTRSIIAGGWIHPGGNTNVIQYVTISTLGNSEEFGDVAASGSLRGNAAFSSSTRGVYGGGADTPANAMQNTIEYITMSTLGNGTDFGDLVTARRVEGGGTSNHIRGVFAGGYSPSPAFYNTIEYVNIASTGNAADFGDLLESGTVGALSDSHGGLS